jgi:hypothetical protein
MKKWFVYLLSVWAFGLSLRFIVSYFQDVTYKINTFDVIFDWGTLFVTSIIVLLISLYEFVKSLKEKENERKISRLRFSERSIRR